MDFSRQIEDNRRALITDVLRRLEEHLWPFHYALDAFLAQLFKAVIPHDWREKFHAFVAEQEGEGFTIAESSVSELETWIEAWAKDCKLWPEEEAEPIQVNMPSAVVKLERQTPPNMPRNEQAEIFEAQLKLADKCYVELERILTLVGQRLDAAPNKEVVEVDDEVAAIDELIYRFYDAREIAIGAWIKGGLPNASLARFTNETRIPPKLGLPSYADPEQLARALDDAKRVSERLRGRLRTMDRIVFAMEVTETAGEAAGYLLLFHGVGTVIVKSTGKWAFAKGVAQLGVAVGGGMVVDSLVDSGLRAAGASENTIKGARLAAAVVSFILARKRIRAEADLRTASQPDLPVGSQADLPAAPISRSVPDENLSGPTRDPDLPPVSNSSVPQPKTHSASLGLASSKNYRNTFFEAHPDLTGQVVVHHAIPQRALNLYPGVILELEMHSLQNLRGIPNAANPDLHLSRIAKEWNQFYKAHKTATREQLIQMATYVDKLFGGEFLPPVGG